VPLALVNEKLLKLDEEWQPSQSIVPVGIWVAGSVLTAGVPIQLCTTPWQLMHPELKPA
jgi:hypothetical protein